MVVVVGTDVVVAVVGVMAVVLLWPVSAPCLVCSSYASWLSPACANISRSGSLYAAVTMQRPKSKTATQPRIQDSNQGEQEPASPRQGRGFKEPQGAETLAWDRQSKQRSPLAASNSESYYGSCKKPLEDDKFYRVQDL